jgi:colanic acid biosynthesis protein WcaH
MHLDSETFRLVVASTPLVSIDLLICDQAGRVLLGQRLNRPAAGCWFVPGGRIYKNETLDAAFQRISQAELGVPFQRHQAQLLGLYEHFYDDSVFAGPQQGPDTHYVVTGYRLDLPPDLILTPPKQQHGAYRWWDIDELLRSADVHQNTKAYLQPL